MEIAAGHLREKSTVLGERPLIFVTVGNHDQGFERLVRKMDEIAGGIDEKVIIQTGHTKYKPKNAESFTFIESFDEIRRLNREARVVVCHAGAGSIITALEQGTPVIAVPRLKRFGEHLNDHQIEIAEAMAEDHRVIVAYETGDLDSYIKSDFKSTRRAPGNQLADAVKKYLAALEN